MTTIKEEYKPKITTERGSWYFNPKMMGERWAAETVDLASQIVNKYSSTPFQKWIIQNCIDMNNTDWHYWG